jgi:hypothetical protein
MNVFEDLDSIYTIPYKTYTITCEQKKPIKKNIFDVARFSRLEMLNSMDEGSKSKLKK